VSGPAASSWHSARPRRATVPVTVTAPGSGHY
jgi:hypothetical protein